MQTTVLLPVWEDTTSLYRLQTRTVPLRLDAATRGSVCGYGRGLWWLMVDSHTQQRLTGKEELAKLVERLDKASTAYGMKISAEKTKLLTEIKVKWTEAWDSHKPQVPRLSYNWWGFQAWCTLQDSTDNSSIHKVETSLEWQEYFSQFKDTSDALPCHIRLSVCL